MSFCACDLQNAELKSAGLEEKRRNFPTFGNISLLLLLFVLEAVAEWICQLFFNHAHPQLCKRGDCSPLLLANATVHCSCCLTMGRAF